MIPANNAPWFTKAGAASGIVPISHFVGDSIFALKGGGYGCLFSLDGIDPESRTVREISEGFLHRSEQQLIFAFEVLVKAAMRQAHIPHDGGYARAGQSFGADTT